MKKERVNKCGKLVGIPGAKGGHGGGNQGEVVGIELRWRHGIGNMAK